LPCITDPAGEPADRGHAIHLFLENGTVTPGYEADCGEVDVDAARPKSHGIDLREPTYVFDPATRAVRHLGSSLGRNYSACPKGWIPITLDRVWVKADGVYVVDDYKTGREAPDVETLQLALGAYCVSRIYDVDEVEVNIVHLDGSDVYRNSRAYDSIDMADIARRVSDIARRVERDRAIVAAGGVPDVRTGPQCRYCAAKGSCPSTTALARHVLSDGEAVLAAVTAMGPVQVGEAWERLQRAKLFVEALERALKFRVETDGAVPLPNGKTLKPINVVRRSIDVTKALPVLNTMCLAVDVKQTISVAAINAAAKSAEVEPKAIWDALWEAQAVREVDTTSYKACK